MEALHRSQFTVLGLLRAPESRSGGVKGGGTGGTVGGTSDSAHRRARVGTFIPFALIEVSALVSHARRVPPPARTSPVPPPGLVLLSVTSVMTFDEIDWNTLSFDGILDARSMRYLVAILNACSSLSIFDSVYRSLMR